MHATLNRITELDPQTPWEMINPLEDEVALANEDAASACDELVAEFAEPAAEPAPALVTAKEQATAIPSRGGGWTIPLVCAGIAIIACCLIIPASDENRRMTWEREKLKTDLTQIQQQIKVNDEFLQRVGNDPTLTERLAQRQMKMVREGTTVMDVRGADVAGGMSPFLLTSVPPPPPMPEYRPVAGKLAALCRNPKARLYMMGGAFIVMGVGLVMGQSKRDAIDDD